MTRSRSKGRAVTPTPADVAAARERRQFALADLDIAPENLRYGEPADDDIQVLAETLLAAGQLQPLTVRPGCGPAERPAMALDGRRRLLALRHLAAEGRIADNHPVEVFVETDPARQAAAAVLTNTAAPIHVADVIAAIGRMVTSGLKPAEISRALGYAEIDIKRLAALSALPPVALEALRAGRMNLRQARLLARLVDPSEQAALAQDALEGRGFADWRVTERLDENRVTTQDPRFALVGADGYAASGGRVEADLFGERASVLLDPDRLTAAWTARARRLALVFEAEGLAVHVAAGPETGPMTDMPDDLERLHYVYGGDLTERQLDDYRAARDRYEAAAEDAAACLEETTDAERVEPALTVLAKASLAMDQAASGGRLATVLVFRPDRRTGIEVRCYAPQKPEIEADADPGADTSRPGGAPDATGAAYAAPEAEGAVPDTEGVSHALHGVRTETATRGLIRALADAPAVALTALIARLFSQLAIPVRGARPSSALAIAAKAFAPTGGRVIDALDGVVRRRLDDRRAAWEASGETVIAWVHALSDDDRQGLLADLTALTLDLHEERTSAIKASARAEAAELARLCEADIACHWTPDLVFLKPHPKPLLLAMLEAMDAPTRDAIGLKKPALMARVVETAVSKTWAPASLSWIAAPRGAHGADVAEGGEAIAGPGGPNGYDDQDDRDGRIEAQADAEAEDGLGTAEKGEPEQEPTPPEADAGIPESDGEGVFVVTLEGAAALRRSAA